MSRATPLVQSLLLQALTADTDPGAGLQGGNEGEDQPPNGDAIPAPPAGGQPESDPDHGADVILARGSQYSTWPASASHTFSKK